MAACIKACLEGNIDGACSGISELFAAGYAASDIITTLFRITKNYDMPEALKLEFIRVRASTALEIQWGLMIRETGCAIKVFCARAQFFFYRRLAFAICG